VKIGITGATGFVGSSLAHALAAAGHEIHALVRPASDRARLDGIPVRWRNGDVTDPHTLGAAFAGLDQIIHAAGMLGQAGVAEDTYRRLHAGGTRNVLDAVAALPNPPRVLYVSSPGVLGPISGPPAKESAPHAPTNAYERTKSEAETIALAFAAGGLPLVVVRPEFIYGPGDTHVLGLFRAVARGHFFYIDGGRSRCHPTFIDDAVNGMLRALAQGRPGEVYHVAGPRPVTFRELGATLADALDVRPPQLSLPRPLAWLGAWGLETAGRVAGFTPPLSRTGVAFFSESRAFDWAKAARELGYAPQVSLAAGVAQTVAWYRARGLLS
jgi:nucleoside-diphosphate-sugar epimerase